jgi:hypothetical protein
MTGVEVKRAQCRFKVYQHQEAANDMLAWTVGSALVAAGFLLPFIFAPGFACAAAMIGFVFFQIRRFELERAELWKQLWDCYTRIGLDPRNEEFWEKEAQRLIVLLAIHRRWLPWLLLSRRKI